MAVLNAGEIAIMINMVEQGRNAEAARLLRAMIAGETPMLTSGDPAAFQANLATNGTVSHALNATFSDTEVEAALNALSTRINAQAVAINNIRDVLVAAGLMAPA